MIRLICCLIMASFLSVSFAGHGDEVNNGSSLAKSNVLFAYDNLEKFIDLCLNMESCHLDESEEKLIIDIRSSLAGERANQQQLQFLWGSEHPEIFVIENEFKVAVTGSKIGSPIYINLDLIAGFDKSEQAGPIDIPKALALLIHELGHHQGDYDHDVLYELGAKVGRVAAGEIYRVDFGFFRSRESITYINYWPLGHRPELLIQLFDGIFDLGAALEAKLECPRANTSLLDSYRPHTYLLHNVHWSGHSFKGDGPEGKILQGHLNMLCSEEGFENTWVQVEFRAELPLVLGEENDLTFYRMQGSPNIQILMQN